jgi:hypothetical protein
MRNRKIGADRAPVGWGSRIYDFIKIILLLLGPKVAEKSIMSGGHH